MCAAASGSCVGDTYIRLYDGVGNAVTYADGVSVKNDDGLCIIVMFSDELVLIVFLLFVPDVMMVQSALNYCTMSQLAGNSNYLFE